MHFHRVYVSQTNEWKESNPLNLKNSISSTVSTFTKGEQMIPVLNKIGTHCAVLGNHDFGKINDFII